MRRPLLVLLALAALIPAVAAARPDDGTSLTIRSGSLTATVSYDPFAITFERAGDPVLATAAPGTGQAGPLGFAVGAGASAHQLGYSMHEQAEVAWFQGTHVTNETDGVLTVATDDPAGRTFTLELLARREGIIEVRATLSDPTGVVATGAGFASGDDERFLGFGERSDGVDQTGRVVTTWSEEGPFSAGAAAPVTDPVLGERWQGPLFFPGTNFPMPWFLSSRGYGFLLDSDWLNGFDLRSDTDDSWTVTTREPALRYRVYAGPEPRDALRRFTADAGRQPHPDEWFFGPWVQPGPEPAWWRENDMPITVAQTYRHYLPCGAQVGNRDAARENAKAWHAQGFKVTTYVNSFVCAFHPGGAYDEGDANGYFIKHPVTGETYPVPYVAYVKEDGPWHGVVDFTNPDAAAWWQGLIQEAIDDGFDGWMEDFGEYVPVDAVMSDGRTGTEYHNRYCTDYHRASHELTWPQRGTDFAQFVRCGYTGTAPYARLVWGADPSEDWSKADGLAAAVSQGQSMGASGIGYWGSDIGGFHAIQHTERTDAELQARWLEFGAFSGVMRTQKTGYPRPGPDTYSNERADVWAGDVAPIWRKFTKLRTQLWPEIWEAAMQYQDEGLPIIRHLALHHPDDPEVYAPEAEYEFYFGDDLLVAPVITEGATERTLYLPEGDWVNFWDAVAYDDVTGSFDRAGALEVVEGGRYVTVEAPLDQIPLFVRAGACLELLPADTDTVADLEEAAAGVVGLADALPRKRTLDFGGC